MDHGARHLQLKILSNRTHCPPYERCRESDSGFWLGVQIWTCSLMAILGWCIGSVKLWGWCIIHCCCDLCCYVGMSLEVNWNFFNDWRWILLWCFDVLFEEMSSHSKYAHSLLTVLNFFDEFRLLSLLISPLHPWATISPSLAEHAPSSTALFPLAIFTLPNPTTASTPHFHFPSRGSSQWVPTVPSRL